MSDIAKTVSFCVVSGILATLVGVIAVFSPAPEVTKPTTMSIQCFCSTTEEDKTHVRLQMPMQRTEKGEDFQHRRGERVLETSLLDGPWEGLE